ncbi:MAG: hypothetical protein NTX03_08550 [Bacteroidetes bacterium]|nr:hypothetical protein [Bacteroidota bacterium]
MKEKAMFENIKVVPYNSKEDPFYVLEEQNQYLLSERGLHFFKNLPEDYKEFIRQFGEGILGESFMIYHPFRAFVFNENWLKEEAYNYKLVDTVFNKLKKIHKDWEDFKKNSLLLGETSDGEVVYYYKGNYYYFMYEGPEGTKSKKISPHLTDVFKYIEYRYTSDLSVFTPIKSGLIVSEFERIPFPFK